MSHMFQLRLDPEAMDARMRKKLSLEEAFGLAFCLAMVGVFVWLIQIKAGGPVDFHVYMETDGTSVFFYGQWFKPYIDLLKQLPFLPAYITHSLINLLAISFAVRVFGGRPLLALLGYQTLSVLYYGNISGILAGALALGWWGLVHKNWYIAGFAFLLAATKYQFGGLLGLISLWYFRVSRREIFQMMILPVGLFLLSLILYPGWLLALPGKLLAFPYAHMGIQLSYLIGGWAYLLWLPALLLPMPRDRRLFALMALVPLSGLYFQQYDLIYLLAMPLGWLPLLGQIGLLHGIWGPDAMRWLAFFPGAIYLFAILPSVYRLLVQAASRIFSRQRSVGKPL